MRFFTARCIVAIVFSQFARGSYYQGNDEYYPVYYSHRNSAKMSVVDDSASRAMLKKTKRRLSKNIGKWTNLIRKKRKGFLTPKEDEMLKALQSERYYLRQEQAELGPRPQYN